MLVRNVAAEVADKDVQVNAIGTNFMDFPSSSRRTGPRTRKAGRGSRRMVPMGRLGTLDELAALLDAVRRRHQPLHHRPVRRLRRRMGMTLAQRARLRRSHRPHLPRLDAVVAGPASRARAAPNVVMVVLDDTGFAHFGCYGSELDDAERSTASRPTACATRASTRPRCARRRAPRCSPAATPTPSACAACRTGTPGSRTCAAASAPAPATVAEMLRAHGYATYAAGKWHLAPMEECSAAGPHTNWPLQKGFDRFYGFLQGETDQFHPELTSDNGHIDPPGRPEDGYHVSEDIVDQATGWIGDLAVDPSRPAVLPLPRLRRDARAASGAGRVPASSTAGSFDDGYDAARERWFARQLELGIVPRGTTLAPRNPGVPAVGRPDRQPAARSPRGCKRRSPRCLEHTDAQIGRLVDFLEQRGLLDNTLLMVLSDNGASQEGGPYRRHGRVQLLQRRPETLDDIVGTASTTSAGRTRTRNYPWGWAQAGNTPLRWYKQNTYGGGVRDPLSSHWPARHRRRAARSAHQFCHAIDITPTILDVHRRRRARAIHNGVAADPDARRRRITDTFDDAAAPRRARPSSTSSRWATAASGTTAGRPPPTTSRASRSTTTSGSCTTSTTTSRSATTSPRRTPRSCAS